jgi:hypothetical protein
VSRAVIDFESGLTGIYIQSGYMYTYKVNSGVAQLMWSDHDVIA